MGCSGTKTAVVTGPGASALLAGNNNDEDIRDKYDFGKVLGNGSFGQVREAKLKGAPEAPPRAVKIIERDNEDGEWSNHAMFVREVALLQQISHENIIRYYDFYEDVHFLYVVMEMCKGGELFAKIVELRRFSEGNAAVLGQQMLKAIEYIHKLKIAHRDIKAENFMLAGPSLDSPVKMIDFGMACKVVDGVPLTDLCGSPHYLAPELIRQKYDNGVDVWSFGVLLYLLMYGHYPYDAKHPKEVMVKILTGPIKWQTKARLSDHALNLLKRCLEHDPKKRVSAEEALGHPWIELATSPASDKEADELPSEVIRSAHRKVTEGKKPVDPKVEAARKEKLRQIDEDFRIGVRHGHRLGKTPTEEFMSKPEFVRRENKIATAPSRDVQKSPQNKLLSNPSGGSVQQNPSEKVSSPGSRRHSIGGGQTPSFEVKFPSCTSAVSRDVQSSPKGPPDKKKSVDFLHGVVPDPSGALPGRLNTDVSPTADPL